MPSIEASTKGPNVIERILAVSLSRECDIPTNRSTSIYTDICRAWITQEFNSSDGATVCAIRCDEHLYDESISTKMPRIPLQSCSMVLQSTNYQQNYPRELKSLLPFAMRNGTPQTNNREHNESRYSHDRTFNVAIERWITNFTIAVNQAW